MPKSNTTASAQPAGLNAAAKNKQQQRQQQQEEQSKMNNNTPKIPAVEKPLHLATAYEDDINHSLGSASFCCIGLLTFIRALGCADLKYNTKSKTLYVRPKFRLLVLLFLFCIIYFFPLSMCAPPSIHNEKSNILQFNKHQYDSYGEILRHSPNYYASSHTSRPLSGIFTQIHDVISMQRYNLINDDEIAMKLDGYQRELDELEHAQQLLSAKFIKASYYRTLSALLSTLRDSTYLSEDARLRFTAESNNTEQNNNQQSSTTPIVEFYSTTPQTRTLSKVLSHACTAAYSTQASISYYAHLVLNNVLELAISISRAVGIGVDTLQYYPECEYYCGYHHLRKRVNHLLIPGMPKWPFYRLAHPFVNGMYNMVHWFIPAEDQIMWRATSFLHTSILRAVVTLELADIVHWYHTNYLYGVKYSQSDLGVTLTQHLPLNAPAATNPAQEHLARIRGIHLDDLSELTCSHKESLERLLRAAESFGFFTEIAPKRWDNTQLSMPLRRPIDRQRYLAQKQRLSALLQNGGNKNAVADFAADFDEITPYPSLAWAVLMFGNEQNAAQGNLAESIESGAPFFTKVYGDFWKYLDLSKEHFVDVMQQHEDRIASGEPKAYVGFEYTYQTRLDYCKHRLDKNRHRRAEHKTKDNDYVDNNAGSTNNAAATSSNQQQTVIQQVSQFPFAQAINRYIEQSDAATKQTPGTPKVVPMLESNIATPFSAAYVEFNNGMESISSSTVPHITEDGDSLFQQLDTLVDIAGGKGHLIKSLLERNLGLQNLQHDGSVNKKNGNLYAKMTNAIVFDLPYTYQNKDTVMEVEFDANNLLNTPMQQLPQGGLLSELQQQIIAQEKCYKIPDYVASDAQIVSKIAQTQTSFGENLTEDANMCSTFTIHQGSFFNVETLPTSYTINHNVILYKYYDLLYTSQLYQNAYKDWLNKLSPQDKIQLNQQQQSGSNAGFSAFIQSLQRDGNKQYHFHVLHNTGYMMMQILHDWNDADSIQILTNLKYAATSLPGINNDDAMNMSQQQHDFAEMYQILCQHALPNAQKNNNNNIYSQDFYNFAHNVIGQYCNVIKETSNNNSKLHRTAAMVNNKKLPIVFSLTHNKKIFIIDRLVPNDNTSLISNMGSFIADVLMMNNFQNAKERTVSIFKSITDQAGLALTRIVPTKFMYCVVEVAVGI